MGLSLITLTVYSAQDNKNSMPIWQKPTPVFSPEYDWLQLHSDEWLKGDIIAMYDDELEFDSDEFGEQIFSWQDVNELRSRYDHRIRLTNGEVVRGFLIVANEQLTVINDGMQRQYPLSELLTITSTVEHGKKLWDAKVNFGLDVSSGNVKQLNYFASAMIQRRTPYTRHRTDLTYNYTKSLNADEKSSLTETKRLTSFIDWFYSNATFIRIADYEYYSDWQQNIKSRHSLGASLGYRLLDNKRIDWDVTLGPSYQVTQYHNQVNTNKVESGALSLSTLLDYTLSKKIDYVFDYQVNFVDEQSGKQNHHLKTGFEVELVEHIDFDITLFVDRVAKPVAKKGDNAPKHNDYRLIISVGYVF